VRARVAVVGGTGFLGRHVVAALAGSGFEPVPLSRRTGFDALAPDAQALKGCDAVVNLAGIKRERGGQTFETVHVVLVERLVAAMRSAGVARLVHVSVVVARADATRPYHDTKHRGEQAVRASGLDWTILRPGLVYGDGDDLLSNLVALLRPGVFPLVGRGASLLMPIDVRDVATGIAASLHRPTSIAKAYDLVGPERTSYREVVRTVAKAAGIRSLLVPVPCTVLRAGAAAMEWILPDRPATGSQVAMLEEGLVGDPAPARADLGVEPRPFTVEAVRALVGGALPETPVLPALAILATAAVFVAYAFRAARMPWISMTFSMAPLLVAALALSSVRSHVRPSALRVAAGLGAGALLWLCTHAVVRFVLPTLWPPWAHHARVLYGWQRGLPVAVLLPTLVVIVAAEEAVWRGIATRLSMQRLGRWRGVLAGAAIYALAHVATGNPLVVLAAAGAGLVWSWLYAATDDLVAPFVCHLAWDVAILFVAPLV